MTTSDDLQLNLESAIAIGDIGLMGELILAGADIEQPCVGPLAHWFGQDQEAQGLTIAGALVYRYVSGNSPDKDVSAIRAGFSHGAGGTPWTHLPRAWAEKHLPIGEISNSVFDQLILLSRPLPERPRKSVFNLYGPSCASIILERLNLESDALQSHVEKLLIHQMKYDDSLSSHIRNSHFSFQLAMKYIDQIGRFPANLLLTMEGFPYRHDDEDCPLLYFLVEQTASKKAGNWAKGSVMQAIEAGSDPNAVSAAGRSALMQAAFHGLPEVMAALLDAGADIDMRDRRKWTAKTYAKMSNVKASKEGKHAAAALLEAWRAKQAINHALRRAVPAR